MQSLAALPTPLAGAAPAPTSLLAVSTPPRIFCATPVYPRRKTKPSSIHIFFRTAVMHLAVRSGWGPREARRGQGAGSRAGALAPAAAAAFGGTTVRRHLARCISRSTRSLLRAAGEQSRTHNTTAQTALAAPPSAGSVPLGTSSACSLHHSSALLPALPPVQLFVNCRSATPGGPRASAHGKKEAVLSRPAASPAALWLGHTIELHAVLLVSREQEQVRWPVLRCQTAAVTALTPAAVLMMDRTTVWLN
jgi:hypothetical protein